MEPKRALLEILKLAAKHEVQYWLDAPGTDAEKLAKIVTICRDALDPDPDAHAIQQEREGNELAERLEREAEDRYADEGGRE